MTSDEQAIRTLIASWLSATSAGDAEKVLSLMADDVVFLAPGQPPIRGKAAFAAGQAALQQFRIEATSEIQEVRRDRVHRQQRRFASNPGFQSDPRSRSGR